MSVTYTDPPQVRSPFTTRLATPADVPALTDLYFNSFNAPFFRYATPDTPAGRKFWSDAWMLGIKEDPTARTFIVFDGGKKSSKEPDGRPAAFARWIVPQQDGNLHRLWPDLPDEWDMSVMGPFFGGMEENREHLMKKRPHWMLELLGTHDDYQGHGLGSSMLEWGCSKADSESLETYLDASEKGQPFYKKHFAFKHGKNIAIPDKEAYGTFTCISLVRPVQVKDAK